ncbi:MAG: AAA family ATPase [Leptospiraceae bacterium]|nr:AAA family ATPase [Leptospiraceae bacterium]MCP5496426.1 AAA family ATPase [Leptospiraceae bacterium]
MKNAKLTLLGIENFKSFKQAEIPLSPLTILIGRNNSGKSSLIQSLLILKQTLIDPDPNNAMLKLSGIVDAFNLRELTFGWPSQLTKENEPKITLEWECEVNIGEALNKLEETEKSNLVNNLNWFKNNDKETIIKTRLTLYMTEINNISLINTVEIKTLNEEIDFSHIRINLENHKWICQWTGEPFNKVDVEFDHFIPYLRINRTLVKTSTRQRKWYSIYSILFEQPLKSLEQLLSEFHYLGANRQSPQNEDGISTVTSSRLTFEGSFKGTWPSDFMDEASDEESAIYYAKLDKSDLTESASENQPMYKTIKGDDPVSEDEP